jgi:hypothetical protein
VGKSAGLDGAEICYANVTGSVSVWGQICEMEEVIELENKIRTALAGSLKAPKEMISDGIAILAGKPTTLQGTRLDRLRIIAKALT